jgi:hypothetical protein
MCNLYTERMSPTEVAGHYGIENPMATNTGGEVYPGGIGMVVRDQDGQRVLQTMTWGFTLRLKGLSPTAMPKQVNNIGTTEGLRERGPGPALKGRILGSPPPQDSIASGASKLTPGGERLRHE